MARSPATGEGSVTEATTLIFPKKSVWDSLLETKRTTKKRAQSQSGIYGQAVKDAVEKEHVDRKALAIVAKLDAMDDDDLHVTMFHMIDGLKKTGILKRAMAQEEMFDENKPDVGALDAVKPPRKGGKGGAGAKGSGKRGRPRKDQEAGGGRRAANNVVQIGDVARTVAEAAGADRS